ncbi:hypothetical protein NBRC116493_26300 [Aurantivibrio infirmus]
MLNKKIFFLCLLLIINPVHADEKRDIVKGFLAPLFEVLRPKIEEMMKASLPIVERDATFPKELRPDVLFNFDTVIELAYDITAEEITLEQAKLIELLMSSTLGEIVMEAIKHTAEGGDNPGNAFETVLATYDLEKLEEEFSQLELAENDLKSINVITNGLKDKLIMAGVNNIVNEIHQYYEDRPFGKIDRNLCMKAVEKRVVLYSVAVCEAGYRAKDYQASLGFAKTKWQGALPVSARDIDAAKSIYKSLLKKDTTGEAHYFLAMLSKNTGDPAYSIEELHCMMKKSQNSGYEDASSALRDFAHVADTASCRDTN